MPWAHLLPGIQRHESVSKNIGALRHKPLRGQEGTAASVGFAEWLQYHALAPVVTQPSAHLVHSEEVNGVVSAHLRAPHSCMR